MMADGVGISEDNIPAFLEWTKELMNTDGIMRLKGYIYIRRNSSKMEKESTSPHMHGSGSSTIRSNSKGDTATGNHAVEKLPVEIALFNPCHNPVTSVGILDVSKQNGVKWTVLPLSSSEASEPHNNELHAEYNSIPGEDSVHIGTIHCTDTSCPLNSVSMSGEYSGDFDLLEANRNIQLFLNKVERECNNLKQEDAILYQAIAYPESKIFIIGKQLPVKRMTPIFRSFLVPDHFVEIGDEEIDFNGKTSEIVVDLNTVLSSPSHKYQSTSTMETTQHVHSRQDKKYDSLDQPDIPIDRSIMKLIVSKTKDSISGNVCFRAVSSTSSSNGVDVHRRHQILRLFDGALYVARNSVSGAV